MRYLVWTFLLILAAFSAASQIATEAPLPSSRLKHQDKIPRKVLPAIDTGRQTFKKHPQGNKAYEFAYVHQVDINPENTGKWQKMPDGGRLWQAAVKAKGAYSLNFTFGTYRLPPGARLFLYTPDKKDIAGAFTNSNNKLSGKLAVRPVKGDEVIVEYYEPANAAFKGKLRITRIGHDYKDAFGVQNGASQFCEVNMNCPEGEEWQLEKRAVAKIIVENSILCTGALINNTKNNGIPYFYTANHCVGDSAAARNSLYFFNYESPNCEGSTGPLEHSLSGAGLKATAPGASQDFSLLQLSQTPPAEYAPYYAGWYRGAGAPSSSFTIHHPSGDVKKISIDNDPPSTGSFDNTYDENTHWLIHRWDVGATEGGSSGAPLFNEQHLIVGDLTGGLASCDDPEVDYYAKLHNAWDDYNEPDEQLQYWLDSDNAGIYSFQGYNPYEDLHDFDVKVIAIAVPEQDYCNTYNISPKVKIQNRGMKTLEEVQISYSFDEGQKREYSWTGSLSSNQAAVITLKEQTLQKGDHTFSVTADAPNGKSDQNPDNNSMERDFTIEEGKPQQLLLTTDDYGQETTWELRDAQNNLLYSGGPYTSNKTFARNLCLQQGCYTFIIKDKAGDGICCGNGKGKVRVFNELTGDTLVAMSDFNRISEATFCVEKQKSPLDMAVAEISMKTTWCNDMKEAPAVVVANRGSDTLKGFEASLQLAGNNLSKNWSGTLAPGNRTRIQFDSLFISKKGTYQGFAQISGASEGNVLNNTMEKTFSVVQGRKLLFEMRTDLYGSETTWSLVQDEEPLLTGGPYKDNQEHVIAREICLPLGCYTLNVYDAFGDGICCGWSGDGYFRLTDLSDSNRVVIQGDEFGARARKNFCVNPLSIQDTNKNSVLRIYPNPAQEFLHIETGLRAPWSLRIFNTTGKLVHSGQFSGKNHELKVGHLPNGVYILVLQGRSRTYRNKMLISRP